MSKTILVKWPYPNSSKIDSKSGKPDTYRGTYASVAYQAGYVEEEERKMKIVELDRSVEDEDESPIVSNSESSDDSHNSEY